MLVFHAVGAPAFAGCKQKPIAHVGDFGTPAPIQFAGALTPAQPINDRFDAQKLRLGILRILRAGQRTFRARAQLSLEIANLSIAAVL